MIILKFLALLALVYGFGAFLAIKAPGGNTTVLFWDDGNDCND